MPSVPSPLRPERVTPVPLRSVSLVAGAADPDVEALVTGITHDSRAIRPGDLYAALPGFTTHGAAFAASARAAGAVAGLTDAGGGAALAEAGLPALVVEDPRAVLGRVAACVYGEPSAALLVIGTTGTNGKTTTSYLVDAGLRAAGHRTGLIGTVETRVGDVVVPSVRTTPESTDLQALLAVMRERGVTAAAMEVSSHALALGRVRGTRFGVVGFTGLSQDHLDFHGDLEDYFCAKASLFGPEYADRAVVVAEDSWGERLLADASVPVRSLRRDADADWIITSVVPTAAGGSAFTLTGPSGPLEAEVQLPGAFNVANAALAVALLVDAGVDPAAAVRGVADLAAVPGRMERVDAGQPFLALVDYAHTPDAVERVLAEARRLASGHRVLAVLGCGGDRDAHKRPLMGRALAAGSDLAVMTSDNPRSEDPAAILAQMQAGVPRDAMAVVEPDRVAAIALAVQEASAGDVLVVLGKGHEQGQESHGAVVPFDDRDVLRRAIEDTLP